MDKTTPNPRRSPVSPHRHAHRFALEPRLMYDAAGLISGLEGLHHQEPSQAPDRDATVEQRTLAAALLESRSALSATALVFVDSRVEEYRSLLGGVGENTRVVRLAADRDGVEQITRTLAEYRGLSSVHIISHGEPGSLQLGSSLLNLESMENQAQRLQQWSQAMTPQGDLLIYGCDVASGEAGHAFVNRLGALTGADVAASDDRTAAASHGGDWHLEYRIGQITADLAPDAVSREGYGHALELERLGGEFQVNRYTVDSQDRVAATELNGGGFVTVWESSGQDGSRTGIYGQVYGADGHMVAREFLVNSETDLEQARPAVAALDDGGFVVAWQSNAADGISYNIYAQRFDDKGHPVGGEWVVNAGTEYSGARPAITGLVGNRFVVTWDSHSREGANFGVYGRIFNASGTPFSDEFHVNTATEVDQWVSAVDSLKDGGFVVVWQSNSKDETHYEVVGQRFNTVGARVGEEFQVNTLYTGNSQWIADVSGLENGGFVVTWNSSASDDPDGSGEGVFAKIYNADGTVARGEFMVNSHVAGNQELASVTAIRGGGFVVAWVSGQEGADYSIYGQQFDSSGQAMGGEFKMSTATTVQWEPVVVSNGRGYVALWQSLDQDGASYGVYGQRFGPANSDPQNDPVVNPVPQILANLSISSSLFAGQSADSYAAFLSFLESMAKTEGSKLSAMGQEQLLALFQQFMQQSAATQSGGEAAAEGGEGAQNGEAAAPGEGKNGQKGEGEAAAKNGQSGENPLAALGATLSQQLKGQSHRTEAERQEIAKALHEIQGLLSCH